MTIKEFTRDERRNEKKSRLAMLPEDLQAEIKRHLQREDFRAAKALFDRGVTLRHGDFQL